MSTEKHEGVVIFLNGKNHIVPSLSLKQFDQYYELLSQPTPEATQSNLRPLVEREVPLILAALQRNYPDYNAENVRDWVGLTNFKDLILAARGTSPREIVLPKENA